MTTERSVDATLELLDRKESALDLVAWVGSLVTSLLLSDGIVTLFIQDERDNEGLEPSQRKRFIRLAPLTQVYLDAQALTDTAPYRIKRYVRPIRTTGRPQFVARKEGELWEVELEPEQNPGPQ